MNGAGRVHDRAAISLRADPARADRVKVASYVVAHVGAKLLAGCRLGAGTGLARQHSAERGAGSKPTHELDPVDDDGKVRRRRVGQKAERDLQRLPADLASAAEPSPWTPAS